MYRDADLLMRPIERRDLEPLRLMHNQSLEFLTDPTPVTPAMQEAWFATLKDGPSRRYAIESEGALVAFVRIDNLDTHNGNACIGLDIMTDLRNRGWGLRCYQLLLQYCFETLRLHLVWLWTADFNSPAIHLYEKLGFQYAGRLAHGLFRGGRFRDLLLMSLLKTDWETNPCTGITKT